MILFSYRPFPIHLLSRLIFGTNRGYRDFVWDQGLLAQLDFAFIYGYSESHPSHGI